MSEADFDRTDPRRWPNLSGLGSDVQPLWQPDEFGAVLRHQLRAAVVFDDPALAAGLNVFLGAGGAVPPSFGDLLRQPDPPAELLGLTKEYAKACREQPDGPLPPEVATLLYYAVIAAALARRGRRITTQDDAALEKGFRWALDQAWVEEVLRDLFRDGLRRLAAPGSSA